MSTEKGTVTAANDPIGELEKGLAQNMGGNDGPAKVIDPATITALVSLFLGLFDACKSRFGQDRALKAATQPGNRERRIAQRLVLRDHFDGDRRAYRDGNGDQIAATVLNTASQAPPSLILAAAADYREDTAVLSEVSEAIDGI